MKMINFKSAISFLISFVCLASILIVQGNNLFFNNQKNPFYKRIVVPFDHVVGPMRLLTNQIRKRQSIIQTKGNNANFNRNTTSSRKRMCAGNEAWTHAPPYKLPIFITTIAFRGKV